MAAEAPNSEERKEAGTGPGAVDARLLGKLGSRNAVERAKAERVLEALGDEALSELLELIKAEQTKRRRREKLVNWTRAAAVAVLIVLWMHGRNSVTLLGIWPHVLNICLGSAAFLYAAGATEKSAVLALRRFEDMRCVGMFVDALGYKDEKADPAFIAELVRRLPAMRASDAGCLNAAQRARLNTVLDKSPERSRLVVAVLKAWQQVGDEKAIPQVERLAMWGSREEIRLLAVETLPFLKERAAQLAVSGTLLRGSEMPGACTGTLLRAAHDAATPAAQELLRAPANGAITAEIVTVRKSWGAQWSGMTHRIA